jgi:hypothetical protein
MAAHTAGKAKGHSKKHTASKTSKHHKAATNKKHHPKPGPTHLQLQHAITAAEIKAVNTGHLAPLPSLEKLAKSVSTPKRGAPISLDDLPVCVVTALAESLNIAGKEVDRDDMLALFHMAGGDPVKGLSILEVLVAAQQFSLGGAYPVFRPAATLHDGVLVGVTVPAGPHTVTIDGPGYRTWGEWRPVLPGFEDDIEEAWELTWH